MNSRFYLAVISALVFCSAPAFSAEGANRSDEVAIRQLNEEFLGSYLKSDVRHYEQMLADDFRCIAPTGQLLNRAEFLKMAAMPAAMSSFHVEDVTIQIEGSIAIVQARTPYVRANGASGLNRYTDIYIKRGDVWKVLVAQVTPVKGL